MGALPKRKISKQRKGKRRSHLHLSTIDLAVCSQCKKKHPAHQVCKECGTYRGFQVLQVD